MNEVRITFGFKSFIAMVDETAAQEILYTAAKSMLPRQHDRNILGKKIDELVRFGLPADKVFECLDENQRILSVIIQLRENGLSNEKFEEWHECHYKEPQRYSS